MRTRRSGTKMMNTIDDPENLTEYFLTIENRNFYEGPVQGEYPDW